MWPLYLSIAGLILTGGLAVFFGVNRSKLARELGEARGEIDALQQRITERIHEVEALHIALEHALQPRPTLADDERVSVAAAGSAFVPGAGDAVEVP